MYGNNVCQVRALSTRHARLRAAVLSEDVFVRREKKECELAQVTSVGRSVGRSAHLQLDNSHGDLATRQHHIDSLQLLNPFTHCQLVEGVRPGAVLALSLIHI